MRRLTQDLKAWLLEISVIWIISLHSPLLDMRNLAGTCSGSNYRLIQNVIIVEITTPKSILFNAVRSHSQIRKSSSIQWTSYQSQATLCVA